jgi:hypothetical protein
MDAMTSTVFSLDNLDATVAAPVAHLPLAVGGHILFDIFSLMMRAPDLSAP